MNEEYLPSRFKHSNVDRFVPFLVRILRGAGEVRINHGDLGLNANTCEHRVRDAVLAIITGKTFYQDLDADKLREVWPLYRVRREELTREIVIELKQKDAAISGNFLDAELRTSHPFFEEILEAYAVLYNHEVYKGRVTIYGLLNDGLKEKFQGRFHNIIIQSESPMLHVLL